MATKKATRKKKSEEGRVTLDVEDIRVDASPEAIASMMSALIHIPSYRKKFEQNPVAHLKECGITVPNRIGKQITPESIRTTLDDLTEGSEERAAATAILPAVAVGVRVGTSPGTRPGVSVGVRVVTGSTTFGAVQVAGPAARPGLAARQKGQAIKRQKRAKTGKSK